MLDTTHPNYVKPFPEDPRFTKFAKHFRRITGFHVNDLVDRDWWEYGIEDDPIAAAEDAAAEFEADVADGNLLDW